MSIGLTHRIVLSVQSEPFKNPAGWQDRGPGKVVDQPLTSLPVRLPCGTFSEAARRESGVDGISGTEGRCVLAKSDAGMKSCRVPQGEGGCLGITLVEAMVILVIVLMLAGIGIVASSKFRDNAKRARAVTDIRAIEHDIYIFEGFAAKLPDDLNQVGKDLLLDPWGNPYQYYNIRTGRGNGQKRFSKLGNQLNTDFDLYSVGRDGITAPGLDKQESSDDIVRANNGEFTGLASEF